MLRAPDSQRLPAAYSIPFTLLMMAFRSLIRVLLLLWRFIPIPALPPAPASGWSPSPAGAYVSWGLEPSLDP